MAGTKIEKYDRYTILKDYIKKFKDSKLKEFSKSVKSQDKKIAILPKSLNFPLKFLKSELIEENYEKSLMCPSQINTFRSYIKIDNYYYKWISLLGFPENISENFYSRLYEINFVDKIIFSVNNTGSSEFPKLKTELANKESEVKEIRNYTERELKMPEYLQFKEAVDIIFQNPETTIANFQIYIRIKSDTIKQLNTNLLILKQKMNDYVLNEYNFQQDLVNKYTSIHEDTNETLLHCKTLSYSLANYRPFQMRNNKIDYNGVLIGYDYYNNSEIILDFDDNKLENKNMICAATSGGGKSATLKQWMPRLKIKGYNFVLIDPKEDYRYITKRWGGEYIVLGESTDGKYLNVFDISQYNENEGDTFDSAITKVIRFLSLVEGKISTDSTFDSILQMIIKETYNKNGIFGISKEYKEKKQITFRDVYKHIEETLPQIEKENDIEKSNYYKRIKTLLYLFVDGSLSVFDNQTTIDFTKSITCFATHKLKEGENIDKLWKFLAFDYTLRTMRDPSKKKRILIDEAWTIIEGFGAGYIEEITRLGRAYNTGLWVITQKLSDYTETKSGQTLIELSALKLLLKQTGQAIDNSGKELGLNQKHIDYIKKVGTGQGLVIIGNDIRFVKFKPYGDEWIYIESKTEVLLKKLPQEIQKNRVKIKKLKKLNSNHKIIEDLELENKLLTEWMMIIQKSNAENMEEIDVDISIPFHFVNNLNNSEINYLKINGFFKHYYLTPEQRVKLENEEEFTEEEMNEIQQRSYMIKTDENPNSFILLHLIKELMIQKEFVNITLKKSEIIAFTKNSKKRVSFKIFYTLSDIRLELQKTKDENSYFIIMNDELEEYSDYKSVVDENIEVIDILLEKYYKKEIETEYNIKKQNSETNLNELFPKFY